MKKYRDRFVPGAYYHVFNRGNGSDPLFFKSKNYSYFLQQYDKYVSQLIETYAYCLLPNHFHILIRVKDDLDTDVNNVICSKFRRFFQSYAQAINKQQYRTGSLFKKNFCRVHIDKEWLLFLLVYFIHSNPLRHNISLDFFRYPYSSYEKILNSKISKLQKQPVIKWFGSKHNYIEFHNHYRDCHQISKYIIE